MEAKKAIELLHPDTTLQAFEEIRYYAGFRAGQAELEAYTEACLIACDAITKQIPHKIEEWNGQASCPCCKKLFGNMKDIKRLIAWEMPYCKWCGQALDWSEDESKK